MKVLLAEDDPGSRRLVNVHLSAAGYEVIEAEDGQLAWELFQHETFQIVITDWMMPKMDGPTLIHNIRSNGHKSYTYIIMLTAIDDKPKVVLGLEGWRGRVFDQTIRQQRVDRPCGQRRTYPQT